MRGMVYLATVIVTKTVPSEHNPALSPTFISFNSVMTKTGQIPVKPKQDQSV